MEVPLVNIKLSCASIASAATTENGSCKHYPAYQRFDIVMSVHKSDTENIPKRKKRRKTQISFTFPNRGCTTFLINWFVLVAELQLLLSVLRDKSLHVSEGFAKSVGESLSLSLEGGDADRNVVILDHVAKTEAGGGDGAEGEVIESRTAAVGGRKDGGKVSSIGRIGEESRAFVTGLALDLLKGEPVEDLKVAIDEFAFLGLFHLENVSVGSGSEFVEFVSGRGIGIEGFNEGFGIGGSGTDAFSTSAFEVLDIGGFIGGDQFSK